MNPDPWDRSYAVLARDCRHEGMQANHARSAPCLLILTLPSHAGTGEGYMVPCRMLWTPALVSTHILDDGITLCSLCGM
jgi:hypothetical protein